jgi:hypothetical protein
VRPDEARRLLQRSGIGWVASDARLFV